MIQSFLSLGSNVQPHEHLPAALEALATGFGLLVSSPVYESEAQGFDGENFLNLVVMIETDSRPGLIRDTLRAIEAAHGRERGLARFSDRTLDIDLLLWGDHCGDIDGIRLPRDEILTSAFVLRPLTDLVPRRRHPQTGQTYARHWATFTDRQQKLWPVAPEWLVTSPVVPEVSGVEPGSAD